MKHIVEDENNTKGCLEKDTNTLVNEYNLDYDRLLGILSDCSITTFECDPGENPNSSGTHLLYYFPDVQTALKIHGAPVLDYLENNDIYQMRKDINFVEQCLQPVGLYFPFYSTAQHLDLLTKFRDFLLAQKESIIANGKPDALFTQSPCIHNEFAKTLYLDSEHISIMDEDMVTHIESLRPILLDTKLALLDVIISNMQKSISPKQLFTLATDIFSQLLSVDAVTYLIGIEERLVLSGSDRFDDREPLRGNIAGNIPGLLHMIGVYCMEMRICINDKMATILEPLLEQETIDQQQFNVLSAGAQTSDEAYFTKLVFEQTTSNIDVLHDVMKQWHLFLIREKVFWIKYATWINEFMTSFLSPGLSNGETLKLLKEISVKINSLEQTSNDKIPIAVKSILTMDEAAKYMGLSTKGSLQSIISEYKKENGKLPDWIGDGKGLTRRFVKRVEFEEWLGSRKSKRGRPTKQNT